MSIPELEAFVDEVIPAEKIVRFREDLLDIEIDVSENIRWHDLRSTFCTLLLKNEFSSCVPKIAYFMEEVMPGPETDDEFKEELLDIVIDTSEYLDEVS